MWARLPLFVLWTVLGEEARAFCARPLRSLPSLVVSGAQPTALAPETTSTEEFSLSSVRASLIRQEETIIFALIERSQFAQNAAVYDPESYDFGAVVDRHLLGQLPRSATFLDFMLFETEQVHARARRFLSPEEHPFYEPKANVSPVIPPLKYPPIIADDGENINDQVMSAYLSQVVPRACSAGDDAQHGSTAICDITCLQALSRRIHFGKFVAESKIHENEAEFRALAEKGDIHGIHLKLENVAVEDAVVRRAQLKAVTFGQDAFSGKGPGYKVEPGVVAAVYQDMIIPLTKQVQVRYILHRLGAAHMIPKTEADWPAYLRAFASDRVRDAQFSEAY